MFKAMTPDATDCGIASVEPHTALILSNVKNASDIQMLVAEHRLYQREGEVRLGSGQIIGPERIGQIVRELDEKASRKLAETVLPPQVIAQGDDMVAWHTPSQQRAMFFAVHGEGSFALQVAWPALLCVARGSHLWLAALASDTRPSGDTPIFFAPLMNQTATSGMCSGSIPMPPRATVENIPAFERAIYETNFSHVNGSNHLRYRGLSSESDAISNADHVAFWRGIQARRFKCFPSRHLLPMADTTVETFIQRTGRRS